MIYPPQVRKVIENLFVFRQEQLCYVLLDLLRQNKSKEKDLLLADIQRIDLEEFDNVEMIKCRFFIKLSSHSIPLSRKVKSSQIFALNSMKI